MESPGSGVEWMPLGIRWEDCLSERDIGCRPALFKVVGHCLPLKMTNGHFLLRRVAQEWVSWWCHNNSGNPGTWGHTCGGTVKPLSRSWRLTAPCAIFLSVAMNSVLQSELTSGFQMELRKTELTATERRVTERATHILVCLHAPGSLQHSDPAVPLGHTSLLVPANTYQQFSSSWRAWGLLL